jgi:thymidylate synthase
MFNKENFVEASFVDSERQNIEVLTKSDDGKSVIPTIIPFDETNHMFKELMDIKTLDELHEDTHNKKKLEGDLYKEQAIAFAKEAGLVAEENKSDIVTKLIEYITKNTNNEDELFALKLGLFEVAEIKDSEDIELKKSLRQSKTKAEVLLNALTIICKE